jgi:RNA polymerase sigma-70 factor (ECF subfamily)
MGVADADAEDASQEVFVQVLRYLGRFEGRAELKTWFYRLCLTQADRLRRRRALLARLRWRALPPPPPISPGDGRQWSEPEMCRRIAEALPRMKDHHRAVFVLYELEALSGEEVAQVLDVPEATVWRRLHHARQEFERLIVGEAGASSDAPPPARRQGGDHG